MFEYENIVKMFIMGFRRRGVIVELDMVVGVRIGIRN